MKLAIKIYPSLNRADSVSGSLLSSLLISDHSYHRIKGYFIRLTHGVKYIYYAGARVNLTMLTVIYTCIP